MNSSTVVAPIMLTDYPPELHHETRSDWVDCQRDAVGIKVFFTAPNPIGQSARHDAQLGCQQALLNT
jgi:hypothetical protein